MGLFKTIEEKRQNRILLANAKLEKDNILELYRSINILNEELNANIEKIDVLKSSLVSKDVLISSMDEINRRMEEARKNNSEILISKYTEYINELIKGNTKTTETIQNNLLRYNEGIRREITDLRQHVDSLTYLEEEYKKILSQITIISNKVENLFEAEKNNKDEYKKLIDDTLSSDQFVVKTADRASEKILNAFNNELASLKETQQKSIAQALLDILTKSNILVSANSKTIRKSLEKDAVFHKSYLRLKNCIQAGVIPMIVGPAGSGKSHAIEQVAADLGLDFYMANRVQNTFELVGFVNAAGEYVTTQFYEAFTKGGLFFFDEVDASSPEALVTINAAVAQGYMAFPGHPTSVERHKDFKVVVAGNTYGTGSTLQYTGRNKLDAATLDRFMIIDWNYDENLEDKLIKDKNLLDFCLKLRDTSAQFPEVIVSTRGIISLEKILEQEKINSTVDVSEIIREKFFAGVKQEKLNLIIDAFPRGLMNNIYYREFTKLSK